MCSLGKSNVVMLFPILEYYIFKKNQRFEGIKIYF